MDWAALRFDWNRVRALVATAELGSLSAASRALGVAQPTLSRQVAALEHELRIPLFERVGRGLTLTPSGLELLEPARGMAEAAALVARVAAGQAPALEGSVRVAAPELLAAYVLPRLVLQLRGQHTGLELKLSALANARSVERGDVDVALLDARPSEDTLSVTRLADQVLQRYAAPGASSEPLRCESELLAWELVKQGVGSAVMLEEVGDSEPRVARVEPNQALSRECWLVARPAPQTSRAVRAVVALLSNELG
jgi:DNA-binding transcriptional LysR family regulator